MNILREIQDVRPWSMRLGHRLVMMRWTPSLLTKSRGSGQQQVQGIQVVDSCSVCWTEDHSQTD
jgi:hypothetical protein